MTFQRNNRDPRRSGRGSIIGGVAVWAGLGLAGLVGLAGGTPGSGDATYSIDSVSINAGGAVPHGAHGVASVAEPLAGCGESANYRICFGFAHGGYRLVPPPGDIDGDGDVDRFDFEAFEFSCFTGPCGDPPCAPALYEDPRCATFDFDEDGDVDFDDFADVQQVFTG